MVGQGLQHQGEYVIDDDLGIDISLTQQQNVSLDTLWMYHHRS